VKAGAQKIDKNESLKTLIKIPPSPEQTRSVGAGEEFSNCTMLLCLDQYSCLTFIDRNCNLMMSLDRYSC
jgi:hypothetical protein